MATLVYVFQFFAVVERMFRQTELSLHRNLLIRLDLLQNKMSECLVTFDGYLENVETLDANLNHFLQIEVGKVRLFRAIIAGFLVAPGTDDPRHNPVLETTTDHTTVTAKVEGGLGGCHVEI